MSVSPPAPSKIQPESDGTPPAAGWRRRLVLAAGVLGMLAACGKKGELELPPVEPIGADGQPGDETP